jgi:hypothetical protein
MQLQRQAGEHSGIKHRPAHGIPPVEFAHATMMQRPRPQV